MIGSKKLIKIASFRDQSNTNSSTKAEKGHFVVYTLDGERFVFPLGYLNTCVFRELLAMSEEEFGLPSNGPITFPCDALFLKEVAKLIRKGAAVGKEMGLLPSLLSKRSQSFCDGRERSRWQVVANAC